MANLLELGCRLLLSILHNNIGELYFFDCRILLVRYSTFDICFRKDFDHEVYGQASCRRLFLPARILDESLSHHIRNWGLVRPPLSVSSNLLLRLLQLQILRRQVQHEFRVQKRFPRPGEDPRQNHPLCTFHYSADVTHISRLVLVLFRDHSGCVVRLCIPGS